MNKIKDLLMVLILLALPAILHWIYENCYRSIDNYLPYYGSSQFILYFYVFVIISILYKNRIIKSLPWLMKRLMKFGVFLFPLPKKSEKYRFLVLNEDSQQSENRKIKKELNIEI